MKGINLWITLLIFLSGPKMQTSQGQEIVDAKDFFLSDSVFELVLKADMTSLLSDIGEEPSYHEAILGYTDPGNHSRVEMKIGVRTRGSFRKKPENCDFPPLKLKFYKDERQGTIFQEIKDLKLVTHCQSYSEDFEQYVFQEYLIYKAYNIFTDFSFRVRLARITYVDTGLKVDSLTRYAFLLENPEDMAERNMGELMDIETVSSDELNQEQLTLMSVFNYMVLNTDYSVPIVHNIELVSLGIFEPPMPVPYDFDWPGLINIPYNSPFTSTNMGYTQRDYKGPCLKRKEFKWVFTEMIGQREKLYNLYLNFPYLDEKFISHSIHELNMFYIIIGSRELVRDEFLKDCPD